MSTPSEADLQSVSVKPKHVHTQDVRPYPLPENWKKSFSYAEETNTDEGETLYAYLHSKVVYRGLKNQGATCYLNSALQVLFMTTEFREAVERLQTNDNGVVYQLQQLFKNLQGSCSVSTVKLTKSLTIKNVCEQQDAVEWFENILNAVTPDASQVYEGTLRKTLRCLKRNHDDFHEDSKFFSLPLSIDARHDEVFSVVAGLEAFFKTTRFDEDNWLYCDHCDEKTDAEISLSIQKFPTILTLHLKRFYFDYMTMGYQKNCCPINIPPTLTCFESSIYDLYGVINHSGVYGSGHYCAYIKSPENNDWYCFDDSYVAEVTDKSFMERSRTAYMIVYRKRESSSPQPEEGTMEISTEEALRSTTADEISEEIRTITVTEDSRSPVVYRGLENQGPTCYLNSALQVLFMTTEFREAVERLQVTPNDNEVLYELQQLFEDLKGDHQCVSTVKISRSLSIKNVCEQQNAVGWFENILNAVTPDASQVYEGTRRKTLRCLKGNHGESHKDDKFFSLPLSIDDRHEVFSVVDGLEAFFKTTKSDEDNWLYCDHCGEKTDTEISSSIQKFPTILTLHLKQFYSDYMTAGYQMNCCPMDIPPILSFFKSCIYDLYGVINHSGVYGSGHYWAYIKSSENNDWYRFDDSQVTKVSDKAFLERSRTAYMIVYRKRESSPLPPQQEEVTMEISSEEALENTTADTTPGNIKKNTVGEAHVHQNMASTQQTGHSADPVISSGSKKRKKKRKKERCVKAPKTVRAKSSNAHRAKPTKKVRRNWQTPTKKPSHGRVPFITPGTVLVLRSGRHRGKRVVFLKHLPSGLLLFTGPFALNRVPMSSARPTSVTATTVKVDISGVKIPETLTDGSFQRRGSMRRPESKGEDGLENEEILHPGMEKLRMAEQRRRDRKAVDYQVLTCVRKVPGLRRSLRSEPFRHSKSWISWIISLFLLVMLHLDAVNVDLLVFDPMMRQPT